MFRIYVGERLSFDHGLGGPDAKNTMGEKDFLREDMVATVDLEV